jgi:hypothetical protein
MPAQHRRGARPTPAASPASAPSPPRSQRLRATALLLRFVSCGLISLAVGLVWRLTLAPKRIGVGTALAGILLLLLGFLVGGVLWYLRDARQRLRDPASIDDERIVFSFVVFVLAPVAVLLLVAVVWVVALLVGVS